MPLSSTAETIQKLVENVQEDEKRIGVLSTGEQLAVALVLDRKDLLEAFQYTMLEAVNRLGLEWMNAAIEVQRAIDLPRE